MDRVSLTWRDALLPVALLALGAFELATMDVDGRWFGVAVEAVSAALLILRRRWPLVSATAAAVVLFAMPWFGPQLDDPAVPIMYLAVSMYSLARWVAGLRGLVGLAIILAAAFFDYVTVDARAHNWSDVMFLLALCVPPYVVGRITRKLADQAELLEQNQELVRREAIRDERDRIARELHDVIAHSVSAMVVQTAAAQDLVRTDPGKAEKVLGDVAATGRRALVETGRLLHVIRDEHDELGLDPAPGLRDVPTLVEAFRESGLHVDLDVDESVPPLPPGLDVSAYRIVQEALTNTLKHAGRTTAEVGVTYLPDGVELCVSDRGAPGAVAGTTGTGRGLIGMRERAHLYGGTVEAGPVATGGFLVRAVLPTDGAS